MLIFAYFAPHYVFKYIWILRFTQNASGLLVKATLFGKRLHLHTPTSVFWQISGDWSTGVPKIAFTSSSFCILTVLHVHGIIYDCIGNLWMWFNEDMNGAHCCYRWWKPATGGKVNFGWCTGDWLTGNSWYLPFLNVCQNIHDGSEHTKPLSRQPLLWSKKCG